MSTTYRNILIVIAVCAIGAAFLINNTSEGNLGAQPTQYLNLGGATTSAATAITSSTRIMATTTSTTGTSYTRVYASICNPNANPVAINLNNDIAASVLTGQVTTWIAAAAGYNTCYVINSDNGYNGSVTASSTSQTSTTITVQQYVY